MRSASGSMKSNNDAATGRVDNWLSRIDVTSDATTRRVGGDGLNLLRITLVALIVMVLFGPIMTITDGGGAGEGSAPRQIGYLLILAASILAIRPTVTRTSWIAFPWPMVVALAWCWASLSWAIDPATGARRALLTTLTAWMVFSLVRHGGYRLAVDILRWVLIASIVLSYFVVFLLPDVGIHLVEDSKIPVALIGNWRGIYGHKNFAGAVSALCIILFLFDARQIRPAIRVAVIVVAGYLLFRSQSKTSAGMLIVASTGGAIFGFLNARLRVYLIPVLTVGGAIVMAMTSAYADLFEAGFSDPASFTGRGHIWSALLKYAGDNLMTGAGFGSFWNITAGSPIFAYGKGYVTYITVGHSGYLDQLVTVGLPGVLLMVFAVAVWPMVKLLSSSRIDKGQGALISAMLMFCVGHNVTESGLFERDMIVSTMFFFAAAFAQYCTLGEKKEAAAEKTGDDMMRELRRRRREGAAKPAAE